MLKFNNTILQEAYERDIFVVEPQVTLLYTCVKLDEMLPHELDAFCPANVARQARKFHENNGMYLHNINVSQNSAWFIINKNGESECETYSVVDESLIADFKLLLTHLRDVHVLTSEQEFNYVPQIQYAFDAAH